MSNRACSRTLGLVQAPYARARRAAAFRFASVGREPRLLLPARRARLQRLRASVEPEESSAARGAQPGVSSAPASVAVEPASLDDPSDGVFLETMPAHNTQGPAPRRRGAGEPSVVAGEGELESPGARSPDKPEVLSEFRSAFHDSQATRRRPAHPAGSGAGAYNTSDHSALLVEGDSEAEAKNHGRKEDGGIEKTGLLAVAAIAIPALGSVLADPLMSLVDTGCVGQVSSLELAALGPNTAIFNMLFQVFAFLGVTTTNMLATNSLNAPGINEKERARRLDMSKHILCYSLTLAAVFGVALVAILQIWGPSLLASVGSSPELMEPALEYLRIRALASPAVLIMNVAQGACLGQQDSFTPLKVFMGAGVFNLVFDWYLILGLGFGVAGAAVATSVAQYLGALYFVWYLYKQGRASRSIPLVWVGWPHAKSLAPFMGVGGTLLSRTAFTMAAFTVITASATMMGTLYTAAHQVALQVFWFLSFVPEPLSMTAQSLIARDSTDPVRVRNLAGLLLKLGFCAGCVLAAAMAGIVRYLPWLFTNDAAVVSLMQPLIPAGCAAIMFCAVVMMFDGVCIGASDFNHLPVCNGIAVASTVLVIWMANQVGGSLTLVWWGLAAFFATRVLAHLVYMIRTYDRSPFGRYNVHARGMSAVPVPT